MIEFITKGPFAVTPPDPRREVAYRWPPRPTFNIYSSQEKLLLSTTDPALALADTLMLNWPHKTRSVILGVRSGGKTWPTWTEPRLQHVERLIEYDLTFDGYSVTTQRLSMRRWQPCTREFRWKLGIRAS